MSSKAVKRQLRSRGRSPVKIYNVFDDTGGTYRYLASCKTRKSAENKIAEICKEYPDIYKKSYLKIRVGKLYD